jgi:hypothetical protein
MKTICYLTLILLLSTPCYSQLFNIPEQYKGNCFVKNVNYWQQETPDAIPNENEEFINTRKEENCPPNSIETDFNDLYDIIHKNTVIYTDGDLKLILNKKNYEYTYHEDIFPLKTITFEIELSLMYKQDIKDKIILASHFYNTHNTFWLGINEYYISPNGDVYLSQIKDLGFRTEFIFWKHYQIDKENLQFKLKKLLIDDSYQYQIIYPDQFKVLNQSSSSVFKTDKLKTCYQDKYNIRCNFDSYRYYHDILLQKLSSLPEKKPDTQESMEIIDKQINQICLTLPPPIHHNELADFTHKITECLVEQMKQKIDKIDEELAK